MRIKQCKLCGSTQLDKIGEFCSNMKIMGPQFSEGRSDIMVCGNCGFVFNYYENADQECFDEYYRSSNSRAMKYGESFSSDVEDLYLNHILSNIEKYISKDSSILDVAGSYGYLAQFLIENGYFNVAVMEIKPECIQSVKENGIAVLEESLFQTQVLAKYDLVICAHTLEHFVDIDIALKKLKQLVKPGGHIYIEVPDVERYTGQDRVPYYYLTYEHVCHFSECTLNHIDVLFGLHLINLNKCLKRGDYPTLCAMYECAITENENLYCIQEFSNIQRDKSAEAALTEYITSCEGKIAAIVQQFETSHTPLILWGDRKSVV